MAVPPQQCSKSILIVQILELLSNGHNLKKKYNSMIPQDLDDLIAENSYRAIFGEPIKGRYREVKEEHGFKEDKEEQYRNEAKTQVKTKIKEEKEEDATKVMLNGTLAENTRAQKNESAETGQDIKIDPPQEFPQIDIKLGHSIFT